MASYKNFIVAYAHKSFPAITGFGELAVRVKDAPFFNKKELTEQIKKTNPTMETIVFLSFFEVTYTEYKEYLR